MRVMMWVHPTITGWGPLYTGSLGHLDFYTWGSTDRLSRCHGTHMNKKEKKSSNGFSESFPSLILFQNYVINQSINNNNSLKTKYQCLLFQIEVAEIKKICS
jgi:hypothetical protein